MDDGIGFVILVFVGLAFIAGILIGTVGNEKEFIADHHTTPFCIEAKVGHEIIKKCYIAKEVENGGN